MNVVKYIILIVYYTVMYEVIVENLQSIIKHLSGEIETKVNFYSSLFY
jgi:hypothetical protein